MLCVAVQRTDRTLTVAMADPLQMSVVQDLRDRTGCEIRQAVSTRTAILQAIDTYYPSSSATEQEEHGADGNVATEATAGELVDRMLGEVRDRDATELQLVPGGDATLVRLRVDGVLHELMRLPRALHDELVARLKILAGLDTAEKLLPQVGRLRIHGSDSPATFRAATLRTVFGETISLRQLRRRQSVPSLDQLGFSESVLAVVRGMLVPGPGLVLVASPPGNGRSTTLAAAMASVVTPDVAAMAIEDPVEFEIPGVSHAELCEPLGLSAARVIRGVIEQRADVVMIGDVADESIAALAAEAARTALVVAGIDALDAEAAVAKFREHLNVASGELPSLRGVVAQRLVRRLCGRCRVRGGPLALAADRVDLETPASSWNPRGCHECDFQGYRGRVAIFEVLPAGAADPHVLRDAADRAGLATLADDAMDKATRGITSAAELRRVMPEVGHPRMLCQRCGAALSPDFRACPRCGERVEARCANCGRALDASWQFCPFCAREVEPPATNPKRGIIRLVRNQEPPDTV
jgi:type II secretory ATPase GspE/PulE/Tfp pilus assembly ATPase PilB-like protein/RNA polymerase subunit RPABC4/transcription elongation factor Spt4